MDDTYFLRASVTAGGCSGLSYQLDFDNEIDEKDQVFGRDDVNVVVNIQSFLYLCDSTLDYTDGLNGKGFEFTNPNATRTCGCGDSFSV